MTLVRERPDISLGDRRAHLARTAGCVGLSGDRCGISLTAEGFKLSKKTAHFAEQERPMSSPAALGLVRSRRPDAHPEKLIGRSMRPALRSMARLRGRAKRGERCRAAVPHGRRPRHSPPDCVLASHERPHAARRADGTTTPVRRPQPRCSSARADTRRYRACDNLPAHKVIRRALNAIEQAGATLLYLPPYSPGRQPHRDGLRQLKAILRKAAAQPSTTLWDAVAQSLERIHPHGMPKLFRRRPDMNRCNFLALGCGGNGSASYRI